MVSPTQPMSAELRTPRAAAIAGIAFAVLLTTAVALLQWGMPAGEDPTVWASDPAHRRVTGIALGLIPYAGIAFLWFIGVIRALLGEREDKLFSTAFLGSGLLFVAMLFTAAAVTGALLDLYNGSNAVSADNARLAVGVTGTLLSTFGIRMAAVFTLIVTNLGRKTGLVPRWLVVIGYLTGLILLLAPPRSLWATVLFPAWVLLLSIHILVTSFRGQPEDGSRR